MFTGMLFGIVLTMWLFPDIRISKAMHRAFVSDPLALIGRASRAHLIFGLVALLMTFSAAELVMVLGSSDLIVLIAWDMSLYIDAVIAVWTAAAVTRVKAGWQAVRAGIASAFRRLSRPRVSRRRPAQARKPANDSDEDGAWGGYALAA